MNSNPRGEKLPVNPSLLGPLDLEPAIVSGPFVLFAGEETYFSRRDLARRGDLLATIRPRLETLLRPGENILHVFPGVHVPSTFHVLGLGVWWRHFYAAAVVLTDHRLIEFLLESNGKRLGTRTLSYPWAEGRLLKTTLGGLLYRPASGRPQKWSVRHRADRRLLKQLVPRIAERLLSTAAAGHPVPRWHCPSCGAESERRPDSCAGCGIAFRTPKLATLLALAIPGGGLFYARHPVLGALDLLGELALYAIFAVVVLASAGPAETIAGLAMGAVLLTLTKLESIHLARLFAARTVPEGAASGARMSRTAILGGAASLVAIALPFALAGALRNEVDHDLEPAADSGWSGGFEPASWHYTEDPGQRSEWILDDEAQELFVFAYPLGPFETFADVGREMGFAPFDVAGLEGVRACEHLDDPQGNPVTQCRYFVFDREGDDLHVAMVLSAREDAADAEIALREFLTGARWVPARR
jgi:hypothetical protein